MSDDKKTPGASDEALKARLAQIELANKMRLQKPSSGADPFKDTPRRGFGSAQGIAHLRHTEYQRRGPSPQSPQAPVPEPGKARFGGTYLRTPLPGIISPESSPGSELVVPIPATPAPPKTARGAPGQAVPPPLEKPSGPGSAVPVEKVPAAGGTTVPPKEAAAAKAGPGPATFVPRTPVVAGSALTKPPLPAVYQAGIKSANEAEKAKTAPAPSKSGPEMVIPEGAEVTKDGPKVPRVKRFKNPTLAPKS